jgi:hypothetical protein
LGGFRGIGERRPKTGEWGLRFRVFNPTTSVCFQWVLGSTVKFSDQRFGWLLRVQVLLWGRRFIPRFVGWSGFVGLGGVAGWYCAQRGEAVSIEIQQPELERRVPERIQSGQFHDVDELLTKALDALSKTNSAATLDWSQCPAVESVPGKVSGARGCSAIPGCR